MTGEPLWPLPIRGGCTRFPKAQAPGQQGPQRAPLTPSLLRLQAGPAFGNGAARRRGCLNAGGGQWVPCYVRMSLLEQEYNVTRPSWHPPPLLHLADTSPVHGREVRIKRNPTAASSAGAATWGTRGPRPTEAPGKTGRARERRRFPPGGSVDAHRAQWLCPPGKASLPALFTGTGQPARPSPSSRERTWPPAPSLEGGAGRRGQVTSFSRP